MEQKVEIDTSQWVDEYADQLFNYANVRLSDHDLAKDLVQDTFISALKGMIIFKAKAPLKHGFFPF